jgi:hypothetical protein
MKNYIFYLLFFVFSLTACSKDGQSDSQQTLSKLQYKWTLVSSNFIYPAEHPYFKTAYTGTPSDYFLFRTDDTVVMHQAGLGNMFFNWISPTMSYSLVDKNTLSYGIEPATRISIKTLTDHLLVLTNETSGGYVDADSFAIIYKGLRIDSLTR